MKHDGHKEKHRILVVDDNANIFRDFQAILLETESDHDLEELREEIFGASSKEPVRMHKYEMDYASQGEEAVEMVRLALEEANPYKLAFVDMRMPPGWDGLKTIRHLWDVDSRMQMVICTAYSDYSWQKISRELNRPMDFLILKKPFDKAEVSQLASALTEKWILARAADVNRTELEDLAEERTRELQKTNEKLKRAIEQSELMAQVARQASESKSVFLANMSHEIRTPMGAVIGFSDMLLEDKLTSDQREFVEIIHQAGNDLLELLDDILDVSKIEAGKLEIECIEICLADLLKNIEAMFRFKVKRAAIDFDISYDENLPAEIYSDPTRLKQCLINLVNNAIKFTERGGVSVQVAAETRNNEAYVRFDVHDTGIGIKEEKLNDIFDPFIQSDTSTTRHFGGTGLGLSITKQLVDLMGGDIEVTSESGEGSTFSFHIPVGQGEL